jgi:hypothetical protein
VIRYVGDGVLRLSSCHYLVAGWVSVCALALFFLCVCVCGVVGGGCRVLLCQSSLYLSRFFCGPVLAELEPLRITLVCLTICALKTMDWRKRGKS